MGEQLAMIRRPPSVPTTTARDFAAVLFRQRRLLSTSFLVFFGVILAYGLISSSYQARMKILLRRGRMDPVPSATPSQAFPSLRQEVSEEELNSEAELLKDEDILRAAVHSAGEDLAGNSWFEKIRGDTDETRTARAMRRISSQLRIDPVRRTNVIEIKYSASDPKRAALVLQCLAHAYLERHQKVRRPSGELNFFEDQVAQSRNGLQDAEVRLMDFSRDQGVISAALERDTALHKLADTETNEAQVRVSIAETVQRIRALETKLHSLPERVTTSVRSSDNPLLLEKMKSKLLELQLKRTELLTKFDPSYRLVQEVDQQITETEATIAAEEKAPLLEETTDQNANHEWAKSELMKAQVELVALESRAAANTKLLAEYHSTAHRLSSDAIKEQELLHDLKTAEDRYLLYVNKREEARIGDALDRGGILNIAIAEEPRPPALPVRSAWVVGFVAVMVASVASTGMAFAADYSAPVFRTPDEVIVCLGTPVLASLPVSSIESNEHRHFFQ